MDYVTANELRRESGAVWKKLEQCKEIVVTRNGKPFALLISVLPENIESTLRTIHAERFAASVRKIQEHSVNAD